MPHAALSFHPGKSGLGLGLEGGNLGSLRQWEREKPRNKEHFEVKTLEAGIVQGRKLL